MSLETLTPPVATTEQLTSPELLIQAVNRRTELLLDPDSEYHERFHALLGIDETPLRPAWLHLPAGGHAVGVMLKDETLHHSNAYKARGGASLVTAVALELPHVTGLTGASAGNFANGVADAAFEHNRLYGTSYTVDMHVSESASPVKVEPLLQKGVTVHQDGNQNLADATLHAKQQAAENPQLEFGSAYDDERVMAGHATPLHETLLQLQESGVDLLYDEVDIVLPLGGGGMAAGSAAWLYKLQQSGQVGRGVRLTAVQVEDKENCSFVDGTYTQTGEKTASMLAHLAHLGVVSLQTVRASEVGNAMQVLAETLGKDVEPAGALATAYVLREASQRRAAGMPDRRYVSMVTGANASRETLAEARRLALADAHANPAGHLALRGVFSSYSRIAAAQKIITPKSQR